MTKSFNLPRILMNDAALHLAPKLVAIPADARLVIAGSSLVRLTLAELSLPGAQIIWTDFRHSASLCALHRAVQAEGGLDRLVLAADGSDASSTFSMMCAVLTLLPAIRQRNGGRIQLIVSNGAAMSSLVQFVDRIGPKLASDGVGISMDLVERRSERTAA